mmetsp:Transcript_59193/g.152290  ORF Transcript_59193/g.152290 Transcript_59193/m.152290 type:complete len:146 (+) Transcript_59193:1637-2074(+)
MASSRLTVTVNVLAIAVASSCAISANRAPILLRFTGTDGGDIGADALRLSPDGCDAREVRWLSLSPTDDDVDRETSDDCCEMVELGDELEGWRDNLLRLERLMGRSGPDASASGDAGSHSLFASPLKQAAIHRLGCGSTVDADNI